MPEEITSKRKRIKELEVMVADVRQETPDTRTLTLFTGNDALDYKPGHFVTIDPHQFGALDRWTDYLEEAKGKKEPARAYSLASAPHEKYLAITVKEERFSPGQTKYPPLLSPLLTWRTPPGTPMVVTGFTGPYVLPDDIEDKTDHLYHVCAGSGVVPNFGIIKHALHHGMKLKHTLILGNKTWEDATYRREFAALVEEYPDKLEVIHALSREERKGTVKGRVSADLLKKTIKDPTAAWVYACGPALSKHDKVAAKAKGEEPAPRFMESALEALKDMGIDKKRIKRESYG